MVRIWASRMTAEANPESCSRPPGTFLLFITFGRGFLTLHFSHKGCTFGAAILTINDFPILTQARSTRTRITTYMSISHNTPDVSVSSSSLTPTHHPPNPSPSRFHLQSARFSLQSTIPPLFGRLNCLLFFCSTGAGRGGKIIISAVDSFIYIQCLYTRIYIYILYPP